MMKLYAELISVNKTIHFYRSLFLPYHGGVYSWWMNILYPFSTCHAPFHEPRSKRDLALNLGHVATACVTLGKSLMFLEVRIVT